MGLALLIVILLLAAKAVTSVNEAGTLVVLAVAFVLLVVDAPWPARFRRRRG